MGEQRRGRIALLAADGASTTAIAKELDIEASTVSRWRGRIAREGIGDDVREALGDEARSGRPPTILPVTRLLVSAIACDPLPDAEGLSGWTIDLLVEELAIRGISGVEKTGMQAVERKHPDRPPGPGRLARQEFEYIRHGTQSLLATLNAHTGDVIADCGPTRTGDDMERHMERVAAHYPDGDVHVVLDNLNIHKGDRWTRFNARHGGRFHFHYTPLHASWVNQIELFFGVLARRSLRRKSFRSTAELRAHVLAFVARWNARDRKPFRWKFAGFSSTATPTTTAAEVRDAA